MGFFDTLKRLAEGKPPFEVPADNTVKRQDLMGGAAQSPSAGRAGPKVIPQVDIERATSRINGDQMLVTCIIQNNSQGTIELDKIRMMNGSLELDSFLRPGEERQYNVYNGAMPQNMNYRMAELYYKDESGDYFCADYNIEYKAEPDGRYSIDEMRKLRIRDV